MLQNYVRKNGRERGSTIEWLIMKHHEERKLQSIKLLNEKEEKCLKTIERGEAIWKVICVYG